MKSLRKTIGALELLVLTPIMTSINLEEDLTGTKLGIVYIDPQYAFFAMVADEEFESDFNNQKEVLKLASENDIPTAVFLYKDVGFISSKVSDNIYQVPDFEIFMKDNDDGFNHYLYGQYPSGWFRERGVTTLYFMGVNTSACVRRSLFGAYEKDFEVMTSRDVVFDQESEDYHMVKEAFLDFHYLGTLCNTYKECLEQFVDVP